MKRGGLVRRGGEGGLDRLVGVWGRVLPVEVELKHAHGRVVCA